MRRTRFLFGEPDGNSRFVHVVTRTAGQEILFGDKEKEIFHKILFKQLKSSGLRALAWCFFTDGVVLGSKEFVDDFFEQRRSNFGTNRSSGARRMKGAAWETLRVLRDLRVAAVG